MGAVNKQSNQDWSSNRNLGKSQLGGVIFGAKNTTIRECLSKQLFGLPSQHLVYVENIDPGLPLFLLNYTDRKLHGVFEAASPGQKNIDPYAWTTDGSQRTPYPAQVQIRVRTPRQPLTENQFKPIITDNYYNPGRFWFELDHAQTNRLLSLFSSQPISVSKYHKNKVENNNLQQKNVGTSFSGKTVISSTVGKDDKELVSMKLKELALKSKIVGPPENGTCRKKVDPPALSQDETYAGVIAQLIEKVEDLIAFKTEQSHIIDSLEKKIISLEQKQAESENELRNLKEHCIMLESIVVGPTETKNIRSSSSDIEFCLESDNDDKTDDDINFDNNNNSDDDLIYLVGGYDGKSWFSSLDCYSPSQNKIKSLKPMNGARCYAPVTVLRDQVYVFGGGTGGAWYDTVEWYDSVVNEWNSGPRLNGKKGSLAGATLNEKIYAIGGGSESEFYSTVEMLDLDIGDWIPARSMLEKRFSLAAVELNGAIYAVGGYDGKNYLKSAERFDPREHSWTRIESMNTMRGCPSLVVLNEKLYVLGGFDGKEMVPSVEIYDPRFGSWVMGESMNYPRGFSAAAAVKDSIHIFGGLKSGEEINDTVECYKEGKGWEICDSKASGRRCFFSAVALSSK